MCTGWNRRGSLIAPCSNYNLLGNVHWLEQYLIRKERGFDYNLLGNVHWLEPLGDSLCA